MFSSKTHEQTIIEFSQGDFIAITAESFLIDRKSAGLSQHTLKFYRQFLNPFIAYCNVTALKLIGEISPDILRRYFLVFAETHNPGGVHAAYRTLRAFFHWPAKFVIHSDANASLKGARRQGCGRTPASLSSGSSCSFRDLLKLPLFMSDFWRKMDSRSIRTKTRYQLS